MGRTFTQLKNNLSKEEFDDFCKKLTFEYADSNGYFSSEHFCKKYNLSKSCFDKIKDYAVVNNLVSDRIVDKMMKKAIENQKRHCMTAGASTIEKYARLMEERKENFEKQIAILFAENPEIRREDFAKRYGLSIKKLNDVLMDAIENNIVNDDIVDAIEKRSMANTKKGNEKNVELFFEKLRNKRKENREKNAL